MKHYFVEKLLKFVIDCFCFMERITPWINLNFRRTKKKEKTGKYGDR